MHRLNLSLAILLLFTSLISSVPARAAGTAAEAATATEPGSGDALYDAFAQVAIQQLRKLPPGPLMSLDATEIGRQKLATDKELDALEQRFGRDPRYWELRAWCLAHDSLDWIGGNYMRDSEEPESVQQRIDFLQRALNCGGASAEAMRELARLRHKLRAQALPELEDRGPLIAAMAEDEKLWQQDLESVVSAWPREAAPHLWLGQYFLELGENDAALTQFRACAEAEDCGYPGMFPENFLRECLNSGRDCGDQALTGSLLFLTSADGARDLVTLKEDAKSICTALALGADPALATQFQRAVLRLATADGADFAVLDAAVVCSVILSHYCLSNLSTDLRQAELDSLILFYSRAQNLGSRERQAMASVRPLLRDYPAVFFIANVTSTDEVLELDSASFTDIQTGQPDPAYFSRMFERYCAYEKAQIEAQRVRFNEPLRTLMTFDYSTMSWPPGSGPDEG